MHILLTGGCGYVGSVLTAGLLEAGYMVSVVDIMWFGNFLKNHENLKVIRQDIRNMDASLMEGVDAIIHLANVANDPCGELDSKLSWEINVLATMQLAENAIRAGVKQFIYASSGSVYGISEEPDVTEDLPLLPISDYNKTKMISERVLLSYKDSIAIQCLRPATVCGYSPRLRLDLSVNMLALQALTKGRITVFGGDQMRPNIHIKDMVAVYLHFLKLGKKVSGIYNAGFENLRILDIAKRITKSVPAEIVVTESNDPRSYRLNSDKLLATGFSPSYCVDDAINELIDAYNTGMIPNAADDLRYFNIKTMQELKLSAKLG